MCYCFLNKEKKKKNIKISNVYRNNAVHVLSNVDKLHATNMRMLNNLNKTEIIWLVNIKSQPLVSESVLSLMREGAKKKKKKKFMVWINKAEGVCVCGEGASHSFLRLVVYNCRN